MNFPPRLYVRLEFEPPSSEAFVGYEEPGEGGVEYVRRDVAERAERETLPEMEERAMEVTIEGPLGPFKIPTTAHPRTREVCEQISRQVFEGEYDHPELPIGPLTVIDVGAGWGAFSAWALKRWPGGCVFGYEPHAEAADVYEENLRPFLGRPGRIDAVLVRAAVTTDPAPRINGCEDWGAYHLAPATDTCARRVNGVDPSELPPCDVLKIDAEGAEVEILAGYLQLEFCRALLVEYHSLELRRAVFEIAGAAGFRCVKAPPETESFGPTVWVRP